MILTVGDLLTALDGTPDDTPIVIEAAGIGKDDRSQINDAITAHYDGVQEIHLVAQDGS